MSDEIQTVGAIPTELHEVISRRYAIELDSMTAIVVDPADPENLYVLFAKDENIEDSQYPPIPVDLVKDLLEKAEELEELS